MKNFGLSAKTVIITGASKGIGAAAARSFVAQGANVVLLARSVAALQDLALELGDAALAIGCDVSNYSDVRSAFAAATERFGKVDVLIGNAGVIDPIGHLAETDPEAWGKVIDINLKGVMYGMHAALPQMVANGGGTIITVSSGAAHGPVEGWTAYCSSKAGAYMLTRAADKEYRQHGVRILGLSPGTVATNMQREIKASGINPVSQLDWSDHIPPEWVAQALMWMCTADADAYLGDDVSLRDENVRRQCGVI